MAGGLERAYLAEHVRTFLFTTVSTATHLEPLSRMLLEKFRQTGVSACRTTAADLLVPVQGESDADPKFLGPSGNSRLPPRSADQGFVRHHLASLRAQQRLVLIDAPTLVDSAETEYVARCADATILVAECAVTTRAELVSAVQLLRRIGVPTIGVVILNLRMRYAANQRHKLLHTSGPLTDLNEIVPMEQASAVKEMPSMNSPLSDAMTMWVEPETHRDHPESAARNLVTAHSKIPDGAESEIDLEDNHLRAILSTTQSLSTDSSTPAKHLSEVEAAVESIECQSATEPGLPNSLASRPTNDVLKKSEQSGQSKVPKSQGATAQNFFPDTEGAAINADNHVPHVAVFAPDSTPGLIAAPRPVASKSEARSSPVAGGLTVEVDPARLANSKIALTSRQSNDVTEQEGMLSRPWCLLSRFQQ